MLQNVFQVSMYFFIPLSRLSGRCKTQLNWQTAPFPNYIRRQEGHYEYAALTCNQPPYFYYRSHSIRGLERTPRRVQLNTYIVRYYPPCKRIPELYFVVGTDIDKVFEPNDPMQKFRYADLICNRNDLVYLKRAFYETGTEGLFYPLHDPTIFLHEWLKERIEWVQGHSEKCIYLDYSVIDIIGLDVDDRFFTCRNVLQTEFSRRYYRRYAAAVDNALHGDNRRFAYGLLFGNENFRRVPQHECDRFLAHGYSNNRTEITYAANKTILSIRTHHPFVFEPQHTFRQINTANRLEDVLNVYEMCHVIYSKSLMQRLRSLLTQSDASLTQDTLLHINQYLHTDLFHMSELDRKVEYIFKGLGLLQEFNTLMKMSNVASHSAEIKTSQRTNNHVIGLAIITAVLAIIPILQDLFSIHQTFTTMKKQILDCCGSTIMLDYNGVFLFLLIAILIIVIILLFLKIKKSNREEIERVFYELENKCKL